jgi:Na+/H+ antiporter NhaC
LVVSSFTLSGNATGMMIMITTGTAAAAAAAIATTTITITITTTTTTTDDDNGNYNNEDHDKCSSVNLLECLSTALTRSRQMQRIMKGLGGGVTGIMQRKYILRGNCIPVFFYLLLFYNLLKIRRE